MYFVSTSNKDFPYNEVKSLYEEYREYNISGSNLPIDDLIKFNEFYGVIVNGKFAGCLYLHNATSESIYLSGFSKRKQAKNTIKAIREFIKGIDKQYIFSKTTHLHAKICLLRAGFKQIEVDLFLYERN
jgi:ssDNA-specific exonuclease RecJ